MIRVIRFLLRERFSVYDYVVILTMLYVLGKTNWWGFLITLSVFLGIYALMIVLYEGHKMVQIFKGEKIDEIRPKRTDERF